MTNPEAQRTLRPTGPRPLLVTIAIWLNVLGLVAACVTSVVGALTSTQPAGAHQVSPWLILALFLVVLALMGGLLGALAFGRRWAWWVWLVLFVLGIPTQWSGLQQALGNGGLSAMRYVLLLALAVAAQVLLLLRPSRQWYGVGRKVGGPSPWRTSDTPRKS